VAEVVEVDLAEEVAALVAEASEALAAAAAGAAAPAADGNCKLATFLMSLIRQTRRRRLL
jgi:hypothetical protein